MDNSKVYVPSIYGQDGCNSVFSDVVGVYLTEKEAYQALCDALCDKNWLFSYDDEGDDRMYEKRVECHSKEKLILLCKDEGGSWYDQAWWWKMQDFPRMPLHFDLV